MKTLAWIPLVVLTGWPIQARDQRDTTFRDGDTIVVRMEFYDNGAPRLRTTYRNGLRHGDEVRWREDGLVQDSIIYQDGEILEDWHWYPNGRLKFFLKSKTPGIIREGRFYDLGGNLVGKVKRGRGTVYKFNDEGKLLEEYEVDDGVFAQ
jgi:antitoxin component YwqK of YwqJK toxin-antitoxin module